MISRIFFMMVMALGLVAAMAAAPALAHDERINLWPGAAPDGPGPSGPEVSKGKHSLTNVAAPYLIVHRPAQANGAAVLLISGGGYAHIELGKESTPAAAWLAGLGVTAFELVYRLPQEGWSSTSVPFQDAQRAMRLIRSRAAEFGIDDGKIGIIGFSAGGHLAGMTAAAPDQARYAAVDAADRVSARPDFVGLVYPVLTMMAPFNQTHAKKSILGAAPSIEQARAWSVELQVGRQMPPTFLAQALDDPIAPVDNSVLMLAALRTAGVPAEMHLFQSGGHGWGVGAPGSLVQAWPALFASWALKNGWWK